MPEKIAIIGAGSWGTALAKLLGEKGNNVLVWAYEEEVAQGINQRHQNPLYLKDAQLPRQVRATNDISEALDERPIVVSVMPSNVVRRVWLKGAAHLKKDAILISCTKGIEVDNLKLTHQVLAECLPNHLSSHRAVLSGPSFAAEVAAGLPTSVTIAGKDPKILERVQNVFRTDVFLTFTNEDVVGVEVGGAVKNVIAIATGTAWGLELGYNARAAIITRGLYEMIKIGLALGANPLTFTGLSGIGDLVLTCTGELSRNYVVGTKLGQGQSLDQITKGMKMVAEGVHTAKAVYNLVQRYKINAPICESIYRILFEKLAPSQAVKELCALPIKAEMGSLLKT